MLCIVTSSFFIMYLVGVNSSFKNRNKAERVPWALIVNKLEAH